MERKAGRSQISNLRFQRRARNLQNAEFGVQSAECRVRSENQNIKRVRLWKASLLVVIPAWPTIPTKHWLDLCPPAIPVTLFKPSRSGSPQSDGGSTELRLNH